MASRVNGASIRKQRLWSFANCQFDESNWVLTVAGRRVAIEGKPLEMLRVLLQRPGDLVTKDELLDFVWPDVEVVEASLPTAVRKLRLALGDDRRKRPIIQTVPRLGYRLAVPVSVDQASGSRAEPAAPPQAGCEAPGGSRPPVLAAATQRPTLRLAIGGGLAIIGALAIVALAPSQNAPATTSSAAYSQSEAAKALRRLDVGAIDRMIAAGWNPAAPWDREGNDALTMLLDHCEWDRAHDRRQMLLMARTLIDGGAPIDRRNVFGDTAYSIAKAPRFCGPDHPVTQMLEAMCYGGSMGPRDKCLATYELTDQQRRAQGLPPKT